ncbi:hypothetical protein ACSBR1_026218 [Camellia fascicularis]
MKIVSWNIRGMGRKEKQCMIMKVLKERQVDVAMFQETKKSQISEVDVRSLWAREKMEFMVVDAEGPTCGLLCIWDLDIFQISECCSNKRFIIISVAFYLFDCSVSYFHGLVL